MGELENAFLTSSNNPYVGPKTFRKEDAHLFFGRTKEAQDLVSILIAERLILFYAQSGAGKTSLLNTRIIPKLQEEAGYEVLPIGRVSGFSGLKIKVSNIFVYNLITSLHERNELPPGADTMSIDSFLNNLVEVNGQHHYDDKFDYGSATELKSRVLLIDQFEELFTTNTSFWKQRDEFFRQIAEALVKDDQLWLMFIMREDFIAGLDPYLHHLPNKLRHRFYMQRLDRKAAREAITEPAALDPFNRPFTDEAADWLLDNLLQIRNVDRDGEVLLGQFVESVQLQVVCFQMWEELKNHPGKQITKNDVVMYADVDAALERFYEDTIRSAVDATGRSEIDLRTWFETQLITESGTRNLVYRSENDTGDLPNDVVDVIIGKFILRPVVRPGGTWYELAHDRFVTSVQVANQAWRLEQPLPRLAQEWIDRGRDDSFLLDGAQLVRFEESEWQVLGSHVAEFMEASQSAQRQREAAEQAEKEAQRQRELEQARALAAAQEEARKRAEGLAEAERKRAQDQEAAAIREARLKRWAIGAGIIAFIFAVIAFYFLLQARGDRDHALNQAATAEAAEADAIVQAVAAANAEADARENAATAEAAKIEASDQANNAATAEADARESEATAVAAESVARIARQIPELNIKTLSLMRESNDNDELAILLSLEAIRISILNDNYFIDDTSGTLFEIFSQPYFIDTTLPNSLSPQNPVLSLAYRSDGQQIAYGTSNGTVIIKDITDFNSAPLLLQGHEDSVWSVAYNPSNMNELASASGDGTIRVWDLTNPTDPHVLSDHEESVKSLAYSPDGNRLASASNDNTVKVWNLDTFTVEIVLSDDNGAVWAVAYNPVNNDELASASDDGKIRIWDISELSSASTIITPKIVSVNEEGAVLSVAYRSDGRQLASADSRGVVRLWNWYSESDFLGSGGSTFNSVAVWSVSYNPINNAQLVFAMADNTVRLWDVWSSFNSNTTILSEYSRPVWSVAYNPNGAQLAYGDFDGNVQFWNIRPPTSDLINTVDSLLEFGCNQVWRNLTWSEWQQYLNEEPFYRLTCPNLPPPSDLAETMKVTSEWNQNRIDQQIEIIKQQSPEAANFLRQQLTSTAVTSTPTPTSTPLPVPGLGAVVDCEYIGNNQWEWYEIQNDVRVSSFTGDRAHGCGQAPSIEIDTETVVRDDGFEFEQCVVKWHTSDSALIAFLSATTFDGYGGTQEQNLGIVVLPQGSRIVESLTDISFTLEVVLKNGFRETFGPIEVPPTC